MNKSTLDIEVLECNPDEALKFKPFGRKGFPIKSEAEFIWKYKKNPDGPARLFILKDRNDRLLGQSVYLPRKLFNIDASTFLAYQGIDTFIEPEARGKGTLEKIQNMALAAIKDPIYSFPNKIAEKIALRNGRKIYAPLEYDLFPLRMQFHKSKFLAYIPNFVFEIVYHLAFMVKYAFADTGISIVELSRFSNRPLNISPKINGIKSIDYLNWRFKDNPTRTYSAFEFMQSGKSLGYIVFTSKQSMIEIYDFLCEKNQEKACLKAFIKWCRKGEYSHIIVQSVGHDFHKFGFFRGKSRKNIISMNFDRENVAFMFGDSDWD
jgi:hypothetical protein